MEMADWFREKYPARYEALKKRSRESIQADTYFWEAKLKGLQEKAKEIGLWRKEKQKVLSYKDAWKSWWDNAAQKDKQTILDIPQFDAAIFLGITGIEVIKEVSLAGKEVRVEIDGKTYRGIIK